MRYTDNDINKIKITQFLDAIGEKPVKEFEGFKLYYAPYRDDPEPMLCVNDSSKRWYDEATDQMGNLRDLAALTASGNHARDIDEYILKMMNESERAKEMLEAAKRPLEPTVVSLDIRHLPITEFMKALGQEQPVYADGNLRRYNAPYSDDKDASMVVNIQTNQWRDIKTGSYGSIYDLAYELTGSCNMRELNHYIASEMAALNQRQEIKKVNKDLPEKKERMSSVFKSGRDEYSLMAFRDGVYLGTQVLSPQKAELFKQLSPEDKKAFLKSATDNAFPLVADGPSLEKADSLSRGR